MSMTTEFNWDDDDFDFDESFILEVDKLEELGLSSALPRRTTTTTTTPLPQPQPSPLPLPPQPHPSLSSTFVQYFGPVDNNNDIISYSPPRELSQRFVTTPNVNLDNTNHYNYNNDNISSRTNYNNVDFNNNFSNVSCSSVSTRSSHSPSTPPSLGIHRFKSELSRVSKQLADLKDECSELRKERDKSERLKSVHSHPKTNKWNSEAHLGTHPRNGSSLCNEFATAGCSAFREATEHKSIGIQTDKAAESVSPSTGGSTSTCSSNPKLTTIWSSRSNHQSHREFVAKLLETCATDLCALFGSLGLNMTSTMVKDHLNHVPLRGNAAGSCSTDATSIHQFYSVLAKLSNNIAHMKSFLETLLNLCRVENAVVVCRCLRIFRVSVDYLVSTKRAHSTRDNVKVKRRCFGIGAEPTHDSEVKIGEVVSEYGGGQTSGSSVITACGNISTAEYESVSFLYQVDWFHLFTTMCQLAIRLTEEHGRVEAVSIMNIILRRMDPYSERGRFGGKHVFEAVALLLKKEAGLFCQKEAVHLLYLLLNCPSILATFCPSSKGTESTIDVAESSAFPVSGAIFEGVADCLVCSGHGVKELNLCRIVIVVLAFLASSGEAGLNILMFHKLSKNANFMGIILQVLVSEIDAEALESSRAPEISKERTLLMREALILLNRLASHPVYSVNVLEVLTHGDMVSLAIDIATRLSRKSRRLPNSDSITRQMRETEVVDLALVFKKRIFTFLGENVSS